MFPIISSIYTMAAFAVLCPFRYSRKQNHMALFAMIILCNFSYLFAVWKGIDSILAAIICFTIFPFWGFGLLTKRRGRRYIFTFCTLNIFTIMLTAFSGAVVMLAGGQSGYKILLHTILFVPFYFILFRERKRYWMIQRKMKKGWGCLAFLSVLTYIEVYAILTYPVIITQRMQDVPLCLLMFATIIATYAIIWMLMSYSIANDTFREKTEILRLNLELQNAQLTEKQLYEKLAFIDGMTKLKNRTAYMRDIESFETRETQIYPFSCISLDLNNLKTMNDTYGHEKGDLLIKGIAVVLHGVFFKNPYVYRVGGDEFCVLLVNTDEAMVEQDKTIIQNEIVQYNRLYGIGLSCAIGVATAANREAFSSVFSRADSRMYEEKVKMKGQ
ncbi:MAG: GGDEF domain-containing protein [Hungatella sp.]